MIRRSSSELNRRLDNYFSSMPALAAARARMMRAAGAWPLYAAAAGSAMAMITNSSAAIIGGDAAANGVPEPLAGMRTSKPQFASSQTMPVLRAVRASIARQNAVSPAQTPAQGAAPSIAKGGIVPVDSTIGTVQPGEWISIYGSNLGNGTYTWNGDFPTSLGGTSVTVNGKPAYVMFVSPGQINVQAPDDAATGPVPVVVTTPGGSVTSQVTLGHYAPSFGLLSSPGSNAEFVAGIILRSDGSGAYGGGSYDILGPGGDILGYSTAEAVPGDTVELFGFGFGPTNPNVPAGQIYTGAAGLTSRFALSIDRLDVTPTFVGLSSAGLYQVNIVIPAGVGGGYLPVRAMVGGMETQQNVFLPVVPQTGYGYGSSGGFGGPGTYFFGSAPFGFGTGVMTGGPGPGTIGPGPGGSGGFVGGGSGGGGSGGGSGGGYGAHKAKVHVPRLQFPPNSNQGTPAPK